MYIMNDKTIEEKAFTIRLEGKILEIFNNIKDDIGIKSDNEVIRFVLKQFYKKGNFLLAPELEKVLDRIEKLEKEQKNLLNLKS